MKTLCMKGQRGLSAICLFIDLISCVEVVAGNLFEYV